MDNVAALGIEQCLVSGLADIFSPDEVMKLSDQQLQEIAAETEQVQAERKRLIHKLDVLKAGLNTLNRFGRPKPAGQYSAQPRNYHFML